MIKIIATKLEDKSIVLHEAWRTDSDSVAQILFLVVFSHGYFAERLIPGSGGVSTSASKDSSNLIQKTYICISE